jgi:hypothetical protein
MQKQYIPFEADLKSYDIARYTLALNRPGRYGGFDTLVPQSNLTFNLSHDLTGILTRDQLGVSVGPLGTAVTIQGVVIEEDSQIGPLTIDTNAGNTATRYDAVVLRHSYASTPGGTPATYLIKKGPLSNPVFPVVDNPATDIILGFLSIPAGATTINVDSGVTYAAVSSPDSGGEKDAKINAVNTYKKLQQLNKGTDAGPTFDTSLAGEKLLTLKADGNLFNIKGTLADFLQGIRFELGTSAQEGVNLYLMLNPGIGLSNDFALSAEATGKGYKAFYIPRAFGENSLGAILPPGEGELKLVECLFYNNKYNVINVLNVIGSQTNVVVAASKDDQRPGVLIDKFKNTDYIGWTLGDDLDKGKQMLGSIKGKEATWDNIWKNLSPLSLDSDHVIVSGANPKYKIDFFGKLHLRDFIIGRVSGLPSNTSGEAVVGSLPITLPRDVYIPLHATHATGPIGMWATLKITSSGQFIVEYWYLNIDGLFTPNAASVMIHVSAVAIDITQNP